MSITHIKLHDTDPTMPVPWQNRTAANPITAKSKKKWLSHLIHKTGVTSTYLTK